MSDRDELRQLQERERALRERIAVVQKQLDRRSGTATGGRIERLAPAPLDQRRSLPKVDLHDAATVIANAMHEEHGTIGNVHTTDQTIEWKSVHPGQNATYVIARVENGEPSMLTVTLPQRVMGLPRRAFAKMNVAFASLVFAATLLVGTHSETLVYAGATTMMIAPLVLVWWARRPQPDRANALADLLALRIGAMAIPRTRVEEANEEDAPDAGRAKAGVA